MEERRKQCLLVEDEAIIAMMVSLELKNAGEEVVKTAATAEESVEYVRNHAIDVILMDIMLKGEVDGVQEAEQIRGRADGQAAGIYAEAFGVDPEFYRFLRTMETYEEVLDDSSTLVLTTDADFFEFLQQVD